MNRHTVWTRTGVAIACALVVGACATRQPETAQPADGSATMAAPPGASTSPRSDAGGSAPTSPSGVSGTLAAAPSAPRDASVYFEFDSSTLSDRGRRLVTQHGDYLARERRTIRIEGNADERGSREYNIALGQRRADAVRQALVLRGIGADRVESISYGEERPRCTSHGEDCYAENRRADIVYGR